MHIEQIYYRLSANLDNGANETITLVAVPNEDEGVADCVEQLRELAMKAKLPNRWEIFDEIKAKMKTLDLLDTRIADRTKTWNDLAHFLRTQGVNPDIPNAPISLPGLPQSVDGEIVESKDEL